MEGYGEKRSKRGTGRGGGGGAEPHCLRSVVQERVCCEVAGGLSSMGSQSVGRTLHFSGLVSLFFLFIVCFVCFLCVCVWYFVVVVVVVVLFLCLFGRLLAGCVMPEQDARCTPKTTLLSFQIAISSSSSVLTPGQPVLALAL